MKKSPVLSTPSPRGPSAFHGNSVLTPAHRRGRNTRRRRPSPATNNGAVAVTPPSSSSPWRKKWENNNKRQKIEQQNDDEEGIRVHHEDIQWKKASSGNVQVEIKGSSSSFAKKEYVTVIDALRFVCRQMDRFRLFSADPNDDDQQDQFPSVCDNPYSWLSSDSISYGDKVRLTFYCRSSRQPDVSLFEKLERSGILVDFGASFLQGFLKLLRQAPERRLTYAVSIVVSSGPAGDEDVRVMDDETDHTPCLSKRLRDEDHDGDNSYHDDEEENDDEDDDDDEVEEPGTQEKAMLRTSRVKSFKDRQPKRSLEDWSESKEGTESDGESVAEIAPPGATQPLARGSKVGPHVARTPPRHPWYGRGTNPWTLVQSECFLAAVALVGPQTKYGHWKMIENEFDGQNCALSGRSNGSLKDRWDTLKRQGIFRNVACHNYQTFHQSLMIPNTWKWDEHVVPLLEAIASQPKYQDEAQRWSLLASSKEANPKELSPKKLETTFYSMMQVDQTLLMQKLRK